MDLEDPSDIEIRFRLPHNIREQWKAAAELRGLGTKAFIVSVVSSHLIGTGELCPAKRQPEPAAPPAPLPEPEKTPKEKFIYHNRVIFAPDDLPSLRRAHSQKKSNLLALMDDPDMTDEAYDATQQEITWLAEMIRDYVAEHGME